MLLRIGIFFLLFTVLAIGLGEKTDPLLFSASLFALCWVIALRYRDYFVILAVSAVFIVFFLYAARQLFPVSYERRLSEQWTARLSVGAVVLLAVIPSFLISVFACVRYLNFRSPNFDFGIFANMFHHMGETGLPFTTSERNGLLSHFAVHLSPIYYLILPFYKLFPSPLTLQIAQGVVLGSSVVPFYLLCRVKRLGRAATLLLTAAAAFYPGMTGGTFYDLHENCFLMPLLLWLFYYFEKGRPVPALAFALLVCAVKEDAAVYVLFFAVYSFFAKPANPQNRQRLLAFAYAALAMSYFVFALKYLEANGLGIMDWRYGQYAEPAEGLIGVVKGVVMNPSLVFYHAFSADAPAKITFIIQIMLPLLFLPLAVKKPHRLLLLCPMLLINLMPGWQYQYNISFQYQFGSGAFLLYAAVLSFADWSPEDGQQRGHAPALCMLCVTLFCYTALCAPRFMDVKDFAGYEEERAAINATLETIPADASVSASTMLLPHLAARDVIYEFSDGTSYEGYNVAVYDGVPLLKRETDYIAIDMRYTGFEQEMYAYYSGPGGWEVIAEAEGLAAVLKKPA
jgi:uncharacterized membrane protein